MTKTLIWIIKEELWDSGITKGEGANLVICNIILNLCLLNVNYEDGHITIGVSSEKLLT